MANISVGRWGNPNWPRDWKCALGTLASMTALITVITIGSPDPAWTRTLRLQTYDTGTLWACPNQPPIHTGSVATQHVIAGWGQPTSGYTWTVTPGSHLPPGISLDNLTGVIHGDGISSDLPTPGYYDFSLTVTDQLQTTQGTFTLHVLNPPNSVACDLYTWPLLVGQNYNIPFVAVPNSPYGATLPVFGGYAPYSWKLIGGAFPAGLALDQTTGVVRGTPFNSVKPGQYTFTVQITECSTNCDRIASAPGIAGPAAAGTNTYTITVCGGNISCPSTTATHDFNGDGKSDILWRDTSGNVAMWFMNGASSIGGGSLGVVPTNWSIVGQRDFNGDGKGDILWRDTSGNTAIWFMNGATPTGASLGVVSTDWTIQGLNAD
jgi:hypothetical protein